jgi:hypothetical protein
MEVGMNTEKSRRPTERREFGLSMAAAPSAEQWTQAFKQQIQLALDMGEAAFAGMERVRAAQLEIAREVQAQGRRCAEAITEVKDMHGLLAAQSALASAQWQGVMRYFFGMAEITQQTNLDCARILQSRCALLGENWKPGTAAGAAQFAGGDLSAAWKSAFDAARASSETMMRSLTGPASWLQSPERDASVKTKAA